jgi:hypothetical protein
MATSRCWSAALLFAIACAERDTERSGIERDDGAAKAESTRTESERSSEGKEEGAVESDNWDTSDECHYDCIASSTCKDGIVYERLLVSVPCDIYEHEYDGQCPVRTIKCEQGCRKDLTTTGDDDAQMLCEENRPRTVGDRCDTRSDCGVGDAGLWCNFDAGTCQANDRAER